MAETDIRAERIKKLKRLEDAGMAAFPAKSAREETIADTVAAFEALETSGKTLHISGRIMSRRGQGGIVFADLYDGTGRIQIVLQESAMEKATFALFQEVVDIGDFLDISGICFKTKRGEPSIQVMEWRMLAKSLRPMPSEWFGVKDEETRLRERTIDMLINPELHAMVIRRGRFWQAIRNFLIAREFLEVETPVLETTPGGADARPFITHHNALDLEVYLRISAGELWQKKLLISGFPKVFEIGRIFRNEGQSREHLQDYTQLETYEAYSDVQKGMKFVQEMYRHIAKEVYGTYTFEINGHTVDLADEWKIIDFCETIKAEYGIDPISCSELEAISAVHSAAIQVGEELNKPRAVDHLWKKLRKTISGPAFLTGVPVYLEPLAKRDSNNTDTVERLQVLLAGSEIGKGYSELNDPLDQRARFEEQQKLREAGDDEAQRLDEDYVRDMEYGMPPAFGFGVSERLFAFLENKAAHEAQLFPLLRPRAE